MVDFITFLTPKWQAYKFILGIFDTPSPYIFKIIRGKIILFAFLSNLGMAPLSWHPIRRTRLHRGEVEQQDIEWMATM